MLIAPAHPPPPTISNLLFQLEGSFTTNFASGQMVPRMSQCSGRLGVEDTSLADSIFTSVPKSPEPSSSHFLTGAASTLAENRITTTVVFIRSLSYPLATNPSTLAARAAPVRAIGLRVPRLRPIRAMPFGPDLRRTRSQNFRDRPA